VIVCEQGGADWLPFRPFRLAKSIARGAYVEVAWVQRDVPIGMEPTDAVLEEVDQR
jgi:hypothetical protein